MDSGLIIDYVFIMDWIWIKYVRAKWMWIGIRVESIRLLGLQALYE